MSWAKLWMERLLSPGSTAARYSRTGICIRRQLSTTERIAAILGPACALPTCTQFFLPTATARNARSALLFGEDDTFLDARRNPADLCCTGSSIHLEELENHCCPVNSETAGPKWLLRNKLKSFLACRDLKCEES